MAERLEVIPFEPGKFTFPIQETSFLDPSVYELPEGIDFSSNVAVDFGFFENAPSLFDADGYSPATDSSSPGTESLSPAAPPPSGDYIFDNNAASVRSPFSKNLFGGNLDVISTLETIVFDPNVDGSLRNSIAYIQTWTRSATSGKTQASSSPDSVPVDTSLADALAGSWDDLDLLNNYDAPNIDLDLLSKEYSLSNYPKFDFDSGTWNSTSQNFFKPELANDFGDFKGSFGSTNLLNSADQTFNNPSEQKQETLQKDIPVGDQSTAGEAEEEPRPINDSSSRALRKTLEGPVYSANPSGSIFSQAGSLLNSFGIGSGFPGSGSTGSLDLSSSQPKSSSLSTAPVAASSGKWQFLFNPSQLTLSVGPNFKPAETWGVGDEPNAGQPLHWTSYKNPELKFSKVLLNGYVFGRRVEELEQGLIKLFMENPSNSSRHGPQVLEFVWGKKVFGPCIIKDVRINQKMWDEGLLVNAEVDFTLVRVPEWTINDGEVSTYDPSAQNNIVAPVASASSSNVGIGSSSPNGGGNPAPTDGRDPAPDARPDATERTQGANKNLSPAEKKLYNQCAAANGADAANFFELHKKVRRVQAGWDFTGAINAVFGSGTSKNALKSAVKSYESQYNKAVTDWGADFKSKMTGELANPAALKKSVNIAIAGETQVGGEYRASRELNNAANWIAAEALKAKNALLDINKSSKCKNVIAKAEKLTKAANEAKEKAAEQREAKRVCKSKAGGSPCPSPGAIGQTCGGTKTICGADRFWKNAEKYG